MTKTTLYYWYRPEIQGGCMFEADYDRDMMPTPNEKIHFEDFVLIAKTIVVADSNGQLRLYSVSQDNKLVAYEQPINSVQGIGIIDICYCNDILYVLHEKG